MISSILDWWILPHVALFLVIGSNLAAKWPKISWKWHLVWMLALAFGWEIVEHFLQRAYPETWSGVVEHWMNAWVVDPVTDLFGGIVGVAIGHWSRSRARR